MSWHLTKYVKDLRFKHPTALLIAGTTGSGKSEFVKKLIENKGIKGKITKIYFFLARLEPLLIDTDETTKIFLEQGLPTQEWVTNTFKPGVDNQTLLIIDDQWTEAVKSAAVENLSCFGRRHYGVSLIYITQNFFTRSPRSIIIR
jgi:DNA helicase HerA-like ATPase